MIENPSLLLEFYSSLGDVYNSIGEYNLSDAYFNKALAIDSSNAIVLNNYAYYLSLRNQNLDLALKMSSKSNDLTKNNGTYQDTYAWILYQMGQYEKAKEWMLKALSNGGESSAVVVEHYGDVLYMLGKKEQALNEWIRAKKIGEGTKFLEKKINDKKLYE